MNELKHSNQLYDIELAPLLSDSSFWLLLGGLVFGVIMLLSFYLWRKAQRPLAKAIYQLNGISKHDIQAAKIAAIICQALQVKHLSETDLPPDFIQALQYAQFSAHHCSKQASQLLIQQAKTLLQQQLTSLEPYQ